MTDQEISEAVARKLGNEIFYMGPPEKRNVPCLHVGTKDRWTAKSIPDYCHSIEAAWEIVLTIETPWVLHRQEVKVCAKEYEFKDGMCAPFRFSIQSGIEWASGESDTAPMAICLAFLKLRDK